MILLALSLSSAQEPAAGAAPVGTAPAEEAGEASVVMPTVVPPEDTPPAPPVVVIQPAPAPPPDPRLLRLTGFVDSTTLKLSPKLTFNAVEHRFRVVDGSGMLSVDDVAHRIGDPVVQARRKREATVGAVLGAVGLSIGAGMLVAYAFDDVNEDPVLAPIAAVTGVAGAVVGIGGLGSVLQSRERPWLYWTPETLAPKLDAWNAANVGPGQPPALPPEALAPPAAPPAPTGVLAPFEPSRRDEPASELPL